jgi:hypothetical protein
MKNNRKIFSRILAVFLGLIILPAAQASDWQFEVTPYLWALNMKGNVGVGPLNAHIDETFGDIFKHLDWAAMVYATAHQDRFGIYGNAMYASLSDSGSFGPISINATNHYGIFGAGISYIAYQHRITWQSNYNLEPYLGARYTINNTTLKISRFSISDNKHWTDPVVGLRLNYALDRQWSIRLAGDVGGTNTTTHYSYSATGLLGYTPRTTWTNTTTSLGYHYLVQHYQTGRGLNFYNWDMRLFGPVLAFSIRF